MLIKQSGNDVIQPFGSCLSHTSLRAERSNPTSIRRTVAEIASSLTLLAMTQNE